MRKMYLFAALMILLSSLAVGCGCLAADSYETAACQKYETHWPHYCCDD